MAIYGMTTSDQWWTDKEQRAERERRLQDLIDAQLERERARAETTPVKSLRTGGGSLAALRTALTPMAYDQTMAQYRTAVAGESLGSPYSYGGQRPLTPEEQEKVVKREGILGAEGEPIQIIRRLGVTYQGPQPGEEYGTVGQARQAFRRDIGVGEYIPKDIGKIKDKFDKNAFEAAHKMFDLGLEIYAKSVPGGMPGEKVYPEHIDYIAKRLKPLITKPEEAKAALDVIREADRAYQAKQQTGAVPGAPKPAAPAKPETPAVAPEAAPRAGEPITGTAVTGLGKPPTLRELGERMAQPHMEEATEYAPEESIARLRDVLREYVYQPVAETMGRTAEAIRREAPGAIGEVAGTLGRAAGAMGRAITAVPEGVAEQMRREEEATRRLPGEAAEAVGRAATAVPGRLAEGTLPLVEHLRREEEATKGAAEELGREAAEMPGRAGEAITRPIEETIRGTIEGVRRGIEQAPELTRRVGEMGRGLVTEAERGLAETREAARPATERMLELDQAIKTKEEEILKTLEPYLIITDTKAKKLLDDAIGFMKENLENVPEFLSDEYLVKLLSPYLKVPEEEAVRIVTETREGRREKEPAETVGRWLRR